VHVACNLSFIVKSKGVFKVTVSHVHLKSGSISGTELDRDTVTLSVIGVVVTGCGVAEN